MNPSRGRARLSSDGQEVGMVSTEFSAYLERLKHHGIPPIPRLALDLHAKLEASPRLLAHHSLVHQAAVKLLSELTRIVPGLKIDGEALLFGAATHDIGKAVVTRELSEPGREHEILGFVLLMENSVPASLARFAKDHGLGSELDHIEGLLVCLADKVWKGKRDQALEEAFIKAVCDSEHLDFWDIYPRIMSMLDAVAAEADIRLAIQAEFPCPPVAEAGPEGSAAFEFHLERIVRFFQKICPEARWSDIRFFEGDPCDKTTLSAKDLIDADEYRPKFCRLLEQGHGWINLSASGVLNDWLILSLVWPSYENTVPREYVSVNLSGPYLDKNGRGRWDLSDRLTLET